MAQKEDFQVEKDNIIDYQLRFQKLLISISTKYINADLSNVTSLIESSLEQIGNFVGADRSYVFSYDLKNKTTSNTFEWCKDGIEPEIENLQNIPINYIQQWLDAHTKGEAFYVEDVSLLTDDGEFGLKAILEPQGIKSLIAIPKIKNNELIGFVGFDSVEKIHKYSEDEKNLLFVFASMLVNIIQRKEQETLIEKQKKSEETLLKNIAKQNQQINEYTQMVSHDLKSPILNIHTLISWCKTDLKESLDSQNLNHLDEILFNVEKMDSLIDGILDYSTVDKVDAKDKVLDLNQLVQNIVNNMSIPDHVVVNIQDNLPSIIGNSWRYKLVFKNLIQNAIEYNDKENPKVEVGFENKENFYKFSVKDNGIGIKPGYFDKVFKVFSKLHNNTSSPGIGLSIVKKIITNYKGDIWIESKENIGTTIYFTVLKQN
ncbi:sensor histidine kinase [Polaribacter dokdonensis]|uniref:histidine kinase n=1 Tax=Polaribacter dokdonensis DSW-5 TaxID=1300348 RepID=A0A0M9CHD2_9FLAO|nr:ATP-binding protein [Polaribacter dokdonensis]KOY52189.1 Two-component system sensor histidine kinase [Polaribacter dokdonensis DSW-5]SED93628.1 GAF domain-containing protein [Polaribacter dokdonensis DSW-5]